MKFLADMAFHNAKAAYAVLQQKDLACTCDPLDHIFDIHTEHCIWCFEPREKIENAKS